VAYRASAWHAGGGPVYRSSLVVLVISVMSPERTAEALHAVLCLTPVLQCRLLDMKNNSYRPLTVISAQLVFFKELEG